jgi:membrane-associated protease RseP (regulator of RpoE activity)
LEVAPGIKSQARRLILLLWLLPAGCAVAPVPAASRAHGPELELTQTGAALEPARAAIGTETRSLPIPSGSAVTLEPSGAVTVLLAAPSTYSSSSRLESATGARSFAPPAPPRPAELMAARAGWLYRGGLVLGVALVAFGLGWGGRFVWIGGAALASASAVGWWVESNPLLVAVMGGGLALAAAGAVAWHLYVKPARTRLEV